MFWLVVAVNPVGAVPVEAVAIARTSADAPSAVVQKKRSCTSCSSPARPGTVTLDSSYVCEFVSEPSPMSVHPSSPVVGQESLVRFTRY